MNIQLGRAMDVTKCEIQRCYIIDSPSTLQPIQFIVPRKAQEFQSDLFPPCVSGEPAMVGVFTRGVAEA